LTAVRALRRAQRAEPLAGSRGLRLTLLAAILALAAFLRYAGLDWGLRHTPHVDERYFVENTASMLEAGDLDHRFYEYPGLFFYMLAPVLSVAGPEGAPAYLAGRALVAACGVASVALVYVLGGGLAGPAAGLAGALLLAVSPVEVHTAHMIRTDVVLELFVLGALIGLDRMVGPRPTLRDCWAGAALGAAAAVKFTGALLAPAYALKRVLAGPPRWRGLVLAAGGAVLAFAFLSPYSLLHLGPALAGLDTQVGHHYAERGRGPQDFVGMAWTYGRILAKALGWAGLGLVAAGVVTRRAEWRRTLPILTYPVLLVAVFSTAEVQRDRYVVSALGVLAAFAGSAVAALAQRSPTLAAAVALLAAVPPLAASLDYVRGIRQPSSADAVLDWAGANLPEGALVVTSLRELGLDRGRYEVIPVERVEPALLPLLWRADAVVLGRGEDVGALAGLERRFRAEPVTIHSGLPIDVVASRTSPASTPLPLRAEWIRVSENSEQVAALLDGDLRTEWRTLERRQRPGAWLELTLPALATVQAVELALGAKPRHAGQNLHLLVSDGGGSWHRLRVLHGRPPVEEQLARLKGASQVLAFDAVPVRAIRLLQVGRGRTPWGIAELTVVGRFEPAFSPGVDRPRAPVDGRPGREGPEVQSSKARSGRGVLR
jgi:4-amino-4-deoxy-L-arabinose transferase-like glycosyltransferase